MFNYCGPVAASKSIYNRSLIIQSYNPQIQIIGTSDSQDIDVLKTALQDLKNGQNDFNCADAGTSFRFLALRVSRVPGRWILRGSRRLMSRPHGGLLSVLAQLGASVEVAEESWTITTKGWMFDRAIRVDADESSQFLSALLLNAWNLENDLRLEWNSNMVSEGYFLMTQEVCKTFALRTEKDEHGLYIPAAQSPRSLDYVVEADMSSCFALVACAIMSGDVEITNLPAVSLQPDSVFKTYLAKMNISFEQKGTLFKVKAHKTWQPLLANLLNSPDLFPVLCVLLARAEGTSRLEGLNHLVHKESNRLENTIQLLKRLNRETSLQKGVLTIEGCSEAFRASGDFYPDQDHRMAMAAQVANFGGAQFNIRDRHVVQKSYSDFWKTVGVTP